MTLFDYDKPFTTGDKLSPEDQAEAKARFVHRYTREHIPAWARKPMPDGSNKYPVQFASDADWLANTRFQITKSGRLSQFCSSCESNPTWPDQQTFKPTITPGVHRAVNKDNGEDYIYVMIDSNRKVWFFGDPYAYDLQDFMKSWTLTPVC